VRAPARSPAADAQVVSNCLENQACAGFHGWPSRAIALRIVSSFRMQAVSATGLATGPAGKLELGFGDIDADERPTHLGRTLASAHLAGCGLVTHAPVRALREGGVRRPG
jgi:hypothetical protein